MEYVLRNIADTVIVDDLSKVESSLNYILNPEKVDFDALLKEMTSEDAVFFCVDENCRAVGQKFERSMEYVWVYTGYVTKKKEPIFVSLLKDLGDHHGYYVGTVTKLAELIAEHYPRNYRNIKCNREMIARKLKMKVEAGKMRVLNDQRKQVEIKAEEIRAEKKNVLDLRTPAASASEVRTERSLPMAAGCEQTVLPVEKPVLPIRKAGEEKTYELPQGMTPVTEAIFENLAFPSWMSIHGLNRYLLICGIRLGQLAAQNKSEYYVLNNIGHAVINTGLISRDYDADFLVMYRYNMKYGTYYPYEIIESKSDYVKNDFTKEQASKELEPICFFNEGERNFQATMDEFDIKDRNLNHIIVERIERFPESIKQFSANDIARKLRYELELDLKIQKRDPSFAKAIYSAESGLISWYLPLHINTRLDEEPELVMVVRNTGDFYELKTILPYDEKAKDRITACSLYGKLW